MRLPTSVIVVMFGLAGVAGLLGFLSGSNSLLTESDVINAGAALWVSETGGQVTDCVGLPGGGEVWIEVRCRDGSDTRTYLFDERGGRVSPSEERRV